MPDRSQGFVEPDRDADAGHRLQRDGGPLEVSPHSESADTVTADPAASRATDAAEEPGADAAGTATISTEWQVSETRWEWPTASLCILGLVLFGVVLLTHGLVPGSAQPTIHRHLSLGAIECLHNEGLGGLDGVCESVGLPGGQRFQTGASFYYFGNLISWLPGFGPDDAVVITQIIADALGFLGVYFLARRIGAGSFAALGASFGYMTSLTIVYMNGYIATFTAFTLLPMVLFLSIRLADSVVASGGSVAWREVCKWFGLFTALNLVLAFMEGYAFIACALCGAIYWTAWAFKPELATAQRRAGLVAFGLGTAVPLVAYVAYVPGGSYEANADPGFFRSMGVDVATLVLPQDTLWWAQLTDLGVDFSAGWGDASAYRANYLGFVLVALSCLALIKSRIRSTATIIAIIAGVGLVLSLGPSLKVYDLLPRDLQAQPTIYDMPAHEATLGLPTALIYEYVPGFTSMRATYRWIALTVLCLMLLASLAVTWLWRNQRKFIAVALGVLALVEVSPNIDQRAAAMRGQRDQIVQWEATALAEFPNLVVPGERLLFLPASNDFLVNELVPRARARSYNVGPDKAWFYARERWPDSVQSTVRAFGTPEAIDFSIATLQTDVDALVIPYFHLRDNALFWPPSEELIAETRLSVEPFRNDDRLSVREGKWFAVVRLRTTST